jgi:hypothetical protein
MIRPIFHGANKYNLNFCTQENIKQSSDGQQSQQLKNTAQTEQIPDSEKAT